MSAQYSSLLTRFHQNPEALKSELQTPMLLWESTGSTNQAEWEKTQAHAAGAPAIGDPLVFPLAKGNHSHNAFALGVTVGRVGNNDIALPDDSVSRFHAFFQYDARRHCWLITDAESKNGTFLEEQRLEANKHVPLVDGARLRFGDARTQFVLAESLIKRLAG